MEKKSKHLMPLLMAALGIVVFMALLIAGTYAWFSSNRRVTADTATARSGTQDISLAISSSPDTGYGDSAEIAQIEGGDVLDPVSTADLSTFFSNSIMENSQATVFTQTDEGYYHGRVYLMAEGTGFDSSAKVNIYIDTDGITVNEDGDTPGQVLNAARVGLVITGAQENRSVIFNLSTEHNGGNDTYHNTTLNGVVQTDDMVLTSENGTPAYTADPSVAPLAFTAVENGGTITLPDTPLAVLGLNQRVTVDIYFYLEGCDSDCTNAIRTTEMSIQLPIYGVLVEGNG